MFIFAFLPLHMQLLNRTFRYGEDFWQTLLTLFMLVLHANAAAHWHFYLERWIKKLPFFLFSVVSVAFQKVSNFKWMQRDICPVGYLIFFWKFLLILKVRKIKKVSWKLASFKKFKKRMKFWIFKKFYQKNLSQNLLPKIKRKLESMCRRKFFPIGINVEKK